MNNNPPQFPGYPYQGVYPMYTQMVPQGFQGQQPVQLSHQMYQQHPINNQQYQQQFPQQYQPVISQMPQMVQPQMMTPTQSQTVPQQTAMRQSPGIIRPPMMQMPNPQGYGQHFPTQPQLPTQVIPMQPPPTQHQNIAGVNPALIPYMKFLNFPPETTDAQKNQFILQALPTILARQQANARMPHVKPKPKPNPIGDFISEEEEVGEYDDASESEPSAAITSSSDDDDVIDYDKVTDTFKNDQNDTIATRFRASRRQAPRPPPEPEPEPEISDDDFEQDNTNTVEHIYCSRQDKETEYLVRFNDSPPAMAQWIPEDLLIVLPNYEGHLARFKETPFEFSDVSNNPEIVFPVSHRRASPTAPTELLYRFEDESMPIYFWDSVSPEAYKTYLQTKTRVELKDPGMPTSPLPEPTNETVVIKETGEKMRDYQVDGLKWLLNSWHQGHGSILADEMGLGKTIQVLAFFSYLNRTTNWHGPFLVAVRTNTFKQWRDEIQRWTDLKYCAYCAGPAQRSIIREYQFPSLTEEGAPIPNTLSFNILLVSYDVFLKDTEYLSQYDWQVLVVDEGHRIKNSQGKKNNAMMNLSAKHRILLTGTPIQNTLGELWTLLRFVSPNDFEAEPDWFENDIDTIARDTIDELQEKIAPHLKRRTVQEVETTIAPKEERVAFVSLADAQRDLIRLTQMHKLYRIKPHRPGDGIEMDSSHEINAILKICSHPFLVEGAEAFYAEKYQTDRLDLILKCSSKFTWLDNVLATLKLQGDRVLIFSQRVKLLRLLQEYCTLRGHSNLMLIGSMSDNDKNEAITTFARSDTFVFLISTRAGNEGLNLITANTAIIFDPDWNPQNDLQAQARCHRIGQTQKVNVLRLVAFQTFEHEMFIRAQNKLALWMTLLGEKIEPVENDEPIRPPPIIHLGNSASSLDECLQMNSTIVSEFTVADLDYLAKPLKQEISFADNQTNEEFLQQFPFHPEDALIEMQAEKNTKRRSNRDVLIPASKANDMYTKLIASGIDHWDKVSHDRSEAKRFAYVVVALSFRSLQPIHVTNFPLVLKWMLPDFPVDALICTKRNLWGFIFKEDSEYYLEYISIRPMRSHIISNAMKSLLILEMKLARDYWTSANPRAPFPAQRLPPPHSDEDANRINELMSDQAFDPFDDRMMTIVDLMKSDLIRSVPNHINHIPWWSTTEFNCIIWALRNFPCDHDIDVHALSSILSKTTHEVGTFVNTFRQMIVERTKGLITIPDSMSHVEIAPDDLRNAKGFGSWRTILVRDCDFLSTRINLFNNIKMFLNATQNVNITNEWSDFHTRIFLQGLIKVGVDLYSYVLLDASFGLRPMLSQNDINYLEDPNMVRAHPTSRVPDFCFDPAILADYLIEWSTNTNVKPESYMGTRVPSYRPPMRKYLLKITEDDDDSKSRRSKSLDEFIANNSSDDDIDEPEDSDEL